MARPIKGGGGVSWGPDNRPTHLHQKKNPQEKMKGRFIKGARNLEASFRCTRLLLASDPPTQPALPFSATMQWPECSVCGMQGC